MDTYEKKSEERREPHQHLFHVVIDGEWAIRYCEFCGESSQLMYGHSQWQQIKGPITGKANLS